jgi:ABC-type Na+ efflux pump, permease component
VTMAYFALLTKEMRLRLRRERTVWIMVVYLLIMGLLGWLFLNSASSTYASANGPGISAIGTNLYTILSQLQLFLIIFITPSFTAAAINGEKERQTYDMLRSSRLSPRSLLLGKLSAGLLHTLLLIAATIPLFSLVFFFGGISPDQIGSAIAIYIVTALWVGTVSMLCSLLFLRPAVSTAIAYMINMLWVLLPFLLTLILLTSANGYSFFQLYPNRAQLLFAWNPVVALISTYPTNSPGSNPFFYILSVSYGGQISHAPFIFGPLQFPYWVAYAIICLCATSVCFLISTLITRSYSTLAPRHSKSRVSL